MTSKALRTHVNGYPTKASGYTIQERGGWARLGYDRETIHLNRHLHLQRFPQWRHSGRLLLMRKGRSSEKETVGETEGMGILGKVSSLQEEVETLQLRASNAGPDMRGRCARLCERVRILGESARRAVQEGRRLPAHLLATLNALQREHNSLANIIQLVDEAVSPEDVKKSTDHAMISSRMKQFCTSLVKDSELDDGTSYIEKHSSDFQYIGYKDGLSCFEEQKDYIMTTPLSQGSSSLASFKKEIEHRVMEQLTGNQTGPLWGSLGSTMKISSTNKDQATYSLKNFPKSDDSQKSASRGSVHEVLMHEAEGFNSEMKEILRVDMEDKKTPSNGSNVASDIGIPNSELAELWKQVKYMQREMIRTGKADAQIQKLENKLSSCVRSEVQEQMRTFWENIQELQDKFWQASVDAGNMKVALISMRKDLSSEMEKFLDEVRGLIVEVRKQVPLEEIELAVKNGTREVEKQILEAREKAPAGNAEQEKKKRSMKESQHNWAVEKALLKSELASFKRKLARLEKSKIREKLKLTEAKHKAGLLKDKLDQISERQCISEELNEEQASKPKLIKTRVVKAGRKTKASSIRNNDKLEDVNRLQVVASSKKARKRKSSSRLKCNEEEMMNIERTSNLVQKATSSLHFLTITGQMIGRGGEFTDVMAANLVSPSPHDISIIDVESATSSGDH